MMAVNCTKTRSNWQQSERITAQFSGACHSYDGAARLQKMTGQTLYQANQQWFKGEILDLGCGTGVNTQQLCSPGNSVTACDISTAMLAKARFNTNGQCQYLQADANQLPFSDERFDAIYSNLMVQWLDDLTASLSQLRQILKPDGRLCIATLTEDTLFELKKAWAGVDDDAHVNQFLSLSQVLGCFSASGFEVELQQQTLILEYPQVTDLARELKHLGANYVKGRQSKGLMGRGKWQKLAQQYNQFRNTNGMLPASYQVAYICARKRENS